MLSIIIPTKNEERFLPKLLDSIRLQTFQPKELMVADADSQDRTRAIAEAYGCQVTSGGLPGVGRNCGAKMATQPYLLFLDADVVLKSPYFLERTIVEIQKRGLDVATCRIQPDEPCLLNQLFFHFYNLYAGVVSGVLPHAPGFCIFAKKELHQAINGFDERVIFCEDHDYAIRGSRLGRFGILHSAHIPVSTRRLSRDGYLKTAITYALAEAHLWTFGAIRHDVFRYRFEYPKT
jgi:glycosyltransferase involved in cell wall biosynthesis